MQPAQNPSIQLTLRDLCCLFCCPPVPSSIVAKLAFMPPSPTYTLTPASSSSPNSRLEFSLLDRTEWPFSEKELKQIEFCYSRSSRGNRIACMNLCCCPRAKYTILFSHGNAVDLGQMCSFYYGLGIRIGCNVFSYDYSGYGCSTGKPSEKNLYADILSALDTLRSRFGVPNERVILYGQSIGTVPTVDIASKVAVAAVILHSPLMSGLRVAFPETKRTWCFDAFPSIEKVGKVSAPTLVIHGTDDEVIDFHHGLQIYEKCPKAVEPLWVHGAGHNDVETSPAYLDRLRQFIDEELNSGN
ncbi:Abhydrolase 5 domain containing protein [Trichuris trichiura]|uniref:palmitoyl-protein hydrolase n=1 Tax=Trichuris trichiura TaxID=36087 RepID=A0A077ZC81_TRITR|nr:Abhydrolase 5 domain containing protein [Trichuris trichiura]